MNWFWILLILLALSSVFSNASKRGRGGPPPVARPPQPYPRRSEPAPAPRPSAPVAQSPAPVAVPAAPATLAEVEEGPEDRRSPATRNVYTAGVEAETRRIAAEAETVAREAETFAGARAIVAEADAMAERAKNLGELRPILAEDAYTLRAGAVGPALGLGSPEELARAVVLAEILGRPRGDRRRLPGPISQR